MFAQYFFLAPAVFFHPALLQYMSIGLLQVHQANILLQFAGEAFQVSCPMPYDCQNNRCLHQLLYVHYGRHA